MELKKYVLFNTGLIYKYNAHSDLYHHVSDETVNVHASKIRYELIKKSSDNILDLIEVGDLVNTHWGIVELKEKYNDSKWIVSMNELIYNNEITTIYKHQPNGDYKRYEVKEK